MPSLIQKHAHMKGQRSNHHIFKFQPNPSWAKKRPNRYTSFVIFSDSLSVLKAMNHTSSKNPQIQKLLEKCHELLAYKEIALCWIPSHIGIQGNEMVDKQAKTSLSLEPTTFKIPFSNFKPSINKYTRVIQ